MAEHVLKTRKRCAKCGATKPVSDFHRHKTAKRQHTCKDCANAAQRARTARIGADILYAQRKRRDPLYFRRMKLRHLYGITLEDYEAALKAQGGGCAICKSQVRLVVDHDHATGRFRGVLCSTCNTALGFVEREGWLEVARAYLDAADAAIAAVAELDAGVRRASAQGELFGGR